MTDRYMGLTVVLDEDYRSDNAQRIIDAILMIKGVAKVTPKIATGEDYINRQRVAIEIEKKLFDIFRTEEKKK